MESSDESKKVLTSVRGLYKMIPIPYKGTGMRVSKLNQYLVYSSREGNVVVYDPKTNKTLLDVNLVSGSLWNLDISSDESHIIAGGVSNLIYYLSVHSHQVIKTFTGHTSEINHCVFSSDSTKIFSASDDGTVRQYDVASGENSILINHNRIVYAFDLSIDEKNIISGDSSGVIKIKSLIREEEFECNSQNSVWCLKFSPHNLFFVSGNSHGDIEAWSLTGELIRNINSRHVDRLRCIDFCDSDLIFASTGNDHLVKFWRSSDWCEEVTYDIHTDWIKAVVFDKYQRTWNCISDDMFISIIPNPTLFGGINLTETGSQMIYLTKLKHLLVLNNEGLSICDLLTGETINKLKLSEKAESICERHDGKILISFQNTIKILNSKTLKFLPQEIEKIGIQAILSPNYYCFIYESSIVFYSVITFTAEFTIHYENINLIKKSHIYIYKDTTFIANNSTLNIYKRQSLIKTVIFRSNLVTGTILNSKNIYVITDDNNLFHIQNNEVKSNLKLNEKEKLGMTCNKTSLFVYDAHAIHEYSFQLNPCNTFDFHSNIKAFLVCGQYYVVIKQNNLITVHKSFSQTFIVKDEEVKSGEIIKN